MILKAAPDNLLVSCHHLSCAYGDNVVVSDVTKDTAAAIREEGYTVAG